MLSQRKFNRIVVKIGSSLLYSDKNKLDSELVDGIVSQIRDLTRDDVEVIIVSSGAIALGMHILKLESRPKELSFLQAAAAIGQHELMDAYRRSFKEKGLNCAQLLLTWEDFNDRRRYLNAKNTLQTLLKLKVIPVINENDTVSTEEIKFGDNDKLSALVAVLVAADLLIILSDVDGLLDKDKKSVIRLIDKITPAIKDLACPTTKKVCVGGMVTKIEAAKIAVDAGIPCIIANGRRPDVIMACAEGCEQCGTLFAPAGNNLASRKRWIAFGVKPKGKIVIDEGASKALVNKKSLLAVGVVSTEGNFLSQDIVSVVNRNGCEIARGQAGLSSKEIDKAKGTRFAKEVIHRNNMVIL